MAVSLRGTAVGPARRNTLTFTFRPNTFIGRTRGQFNKLQGRATAAHEAMAVELQERMVEHLRDQIHKTGRPQRGTRELETALGAQGNRHANMDGFSVGDERFMDRSPAGPYWRNLEQGTRIFVGRFVQALFFDEGGTAHPASRERRRQDVRMPQFTFQGPRAGSAAGRSGGQLLSIGHQPGFQIREPIPAYHYMTDPWQHWIGEGRERAIYREHFADLVAQGILRL